MTDSKLRTGPVAPGKRDRLIAAAAQMVYEQGVEATTIADIAQAADIPVGNVYYYFKAKNDIIAAVIDSRAGDIRRLLAAIEASHDRPADRVKALLRAIGGDGEVVARFGCPLGTLCQELSKHPGAPDPSSLLRLPIDWAERQFAAMGRADARDLAVQVIAAYQGTALLTSALRDPGVMARESARIEAWLDSL